ncbi:alpha/beta hydrolase [Roseobacter cerasinus]|uniref:Alpha/beta hydrolase n=1 Tax=Roseobacter cerasinus TaxID=2602289 RepID=A0A640VMP0_9RHOB|nr:alpha/beta hydrolase [Roseobacter cerasinus]GFE48987.1 alpha/beta hydrolase [Roseobacter cerasinus]
MTTSQNNGSEKQTLAAADLLREYPSVWIHGAGLSGSTWQDITQDLPKAQTPDLPGHGAAPQIDPPRVEGFAEVLLHDMPEGCVLIGHSLGGMVALDMAARAPGRIAALIIVEAVPTVRDTWFQRVSAQLAAGIFSHLSPKLLAWLSGLGERGQARNEMRAQLARHSKRSLSQALYAALAYDGRAHLAEITVPTLVITGRRNRATHRGAALIAAQVPRAEHVMLGGGHMLHIDNPDGLREAINSFLHRRLP